MQDEHEKVKEEHKSLEAQDSGCGQSVLAAQGKWRTAAHAQPKAGLLMRQIDLGVGGGLVGWALVKECCRFLCAVLVQITSWDFCKIEPRGERLGVP